MVKLATQLAQALAHSGKTHAGRLHGGRNSRHFEAATEVTHLDANAIRLRLQAHARQLAARVFLNVRERFLHDPKQRQLLVRLQSHARRRQFKLYGDAAARGEPIDQPAQRGRQPELVEQWWVQQVGCRANFLRALASKL